MPFKKCYPVAALLLYALLTSGCATILNQNLQRIAIATAANVKVLAVKGATPTEYMARVQHNARVYYAKRSAKPITIQLQVDTTIKNIVIKPRNSAAFWLNIYCNYGAGMLIDLNNPRRYSYPAYNYINAAGTRVNLQRFAPVKKGHVNVEFTIPFITAFNIRALGAQHNSAGIFGIEAGLDYYWKTNQYLSFTTGAGTDRLPVDYFGVGYIQTAWAAYASIRNNMVSGSFDVGYGLGLNRYSWQKTSYASTTLPAIRQSNTSIGLSLSAQYKLDKNIRLGVLYQPSFFNIDSKPSTSYQHYLSFNVCIKFPFK